MPDKEIVESHDYADDALLDVNSVAAIVGFRPYTIREWVRLGKFPPPVHVGRNVRWYGRVVREWIKRRVAGGQPPAAG